MLGTAADLGQSRDGGTCAGDEPGQRSAGHAPVGHGCIEGTGRGQTGAHCDEVSYFNTGLTCFLCSCASGRIQRLKGM